MGASHSEGCGLWGGQEFCTGVVRRLGGFFLFFFSFFFFGFMVLGSCGMPPWELV